MLLLQELNNACVDNFLDSGILQIWANEAEIDKVMPEDKWLEDMSHFLTTALPPPWVRADDKKQLEV